MSDAMQRIRRQLDAVIEEAATAIEAQQAAAAAAIEEAHSSRAVAAAYDQGRHDQRQQILAMIQEQRSYLRVGGTNALSLATLAKAIAELS